MAENKMAESMAKLESQEQKIASINKKLVDFKQQNVNLQFQLRMREKQISELEDVKLINLQLESQNQSKQQLIY